MDALQSIYRLIPIEEGGRIARNGFIYQDHVGAKFLMCLLKAKTDHEILFEADDDIVIINKKETPVNVELIQVKSNALDSRWSVAQMIDLEVLQKSLQRGRCSEDVSYQVITAYDVNDELSVMKEQLLSTNRTTEKIDKIVSAVNAKKKDILTNEKGHDVQYWVNNCLWAKWPESIEALRNENVVFLEKYLYESRGITLPIDQKDELYQKLLALVQKASSETKEIFDKEKITAWLDLQILNFSAPTQGSEKLIEKLAPISIDDTLIEVAKEFRWKYTLESLNHTFFSVSAITKFKEEAQCLLQSLKLKFDDDNKPLNSVTFHKHCIEQIDKLAETHKIDIAIARGCMYDITNRCMHRFIKATA
jgi:hypothetical protein